MPGIVTLIEPVNRSDEARIARYNDAREFFEGWQWLGRPRRKETRYVLNYARRIVQAAISYMFAAPVQFNVPASEETEASAAAARLAEQTLAGYLGHIGADELDNQLALDAAVSGDAAVKVTWDAALGMPSVVAVDPALLSVTVRADRPKEMVAISHQYRMTGEELAAALPHAAGNIGRVPSAPGSAAQTVREWWSAGRWRVEFAGAVVLDAVNPYGWIPYVVVANNPTARDFWGSSDLRDLFDVCRELNTRMSVFSDVLNLSGWPIAVLENVDGSEGISVGPGAKWELPEDSKAYLLDLLAGGGAKLHLDGIDKLLRALHDLGETPRTAFGDSGRDLSGAALEVEIQPLVQKVRRKRRGFDTFYRERNTRLLDLAERFGAVPLGGVRRAIAVWPDILPSDATAEAQRMRDLVGAEIFAHRTAMAELGIEDPEGEWARVLEERGAGAEGEGDPAEGDPAAKEAGE